MNEQKPFAEWSDIPGYEGLYQVSRDGQVRRLPGVVSRSNSGLSINGRVMSPRIKNSGYLFISLSKGGQRKNAYIHHLVAQVFIGDRPLKHDINHIDGNKLNNSASNLEYVTRTENMRHARELGLHDNRGEKQWQAKLTDDDARTILLIKSIGMGETTIKELAEEFGVSTWTIKDVLNRRSFKHISDIV